MGDTENETGNLNIDGPLFDHDLDCIFVKGGPDTAFVSEMEEPDQSAPPTVNQGIFETKWTAPAVSRLLDLVEERKQRIIVEGSLEPRTKLRYAEWHPIGKILQAEGFPYTGASCQKKFMNMKKSYYNNRRIVLARKAMAEKAKKPLTEPIELVWPYYFRFGILLDEAADDDVVLKDFTNPEKREKRKRASKHNLEDTDEEHEEVEEDEDETEDYVTPRSAKTKRTKSKETSSISTLSSSDKHYAEVTDGIHSLLKSQPVIILEDDAGDGAEEAEDPELDGWHSLGVVMIPDSPNNGLDDVKMEPLDSDSESARDLIARLQRRKLQVVLPRVSSTAECESEPLPKRSRRSRVRYSPAAQEGSTVTSPRVNLGLGPPQKNKTFTLDSLTSEEVLGEIKHLRKDLSRMNRNLEELTDSHKELSDNFQKLYKLMTRRFK